MRFFLCILCIFFSACSFQRYSSEVELGKYYFQQGDFKAAFRQLMPAAIAGNPKAQYAIGYMYYNGYGVVHDEESGLFWMQRAAEKGYPPAINAMEKIMQRAPIDSVYKGDVVVKKESNCITKNLQK